MAGNSVNARKNTRAVIIGGGRGGLGLLSLFLESDGISVAALVDQNPEAVGARLAREKGIPVLQSIGELSSLRDADLFINVTGNAGITAAIGEVIGDRSKIMDGHISGVIYRLMHSMHAMRREIQTNAEYLENIINNSADMIITTDAQGNIVRFNRGGTMMLGYEEHEVRGRRMSDFYADSSDREKALEILKKEGAVRNFETKLRAKDGRIIDISLTLSELKASDGSSAGTVGISRDITEEKKNKELIKRQNQELKEFNENLENLVKKRTAEIEAANERLKTLNQYKSQFIANMSHELRTPLNSIIGFSEILSDGTFGELNPKQLKYANNIHKSGVHLLQIINDILDLSKIDAGKMDLHKTVFDLNELIAGSISMFESQAAKKRLNLVCETSPDKILVDADPGRIKQVLFNLLSNAVKFTPEGGTVTAGTQTDGSRVLVYVKDTGIGIARKDQQRVFSEFEQVDNSYSREYEGTGLGLPLVKKFLEMHQSEILLESEPGRGSVFSFYLDTVQSKDKKTEKDNEDSSDGTPEPSSEQLKRETSNEAEIMTPEILVIEDDPLAMELMTIFLTREGFRVHHAYSGKEGLEKARDIHPAAVILDIMLPNMDGWEVLQALKKNDVTSDIPVIMVSMTDNRELAFTLGAMDFLRKPVDKETLKNLLQRIIDQYYSGRDTVRILIVDDLEENLLLVTDILHPLKKYYNLITQTARGGMEALASVAQWVPDIIILDLMMPEVSGFEVIKKLKEKPETASVPVIVLTAMNLTVEQKADLEKNIHKVILKSEMDFRSFLDEIKKLLQFSMKSKTARE